METGFRWDESKAVTVNATAVQVKANRQEVMLFFGRHRETTEDEVLLWLDDLIIVSPVLAKRLLVMLQTMIEQHQQRYGDAGRRAARAERPSDRQAKSHLRLPLFDSPKAAEKSALLLKLLNDLNVAVALERSFKISKKSLLANRFLLAFKTEQLRQDRLARVSAIASELNMPANFVKSFSENLEEATSLGFGIEEDAKACVVKAYVEFQNRYRDVMEKPRSDSYISLLGFKWDADDNTNTAFARYTCFPRLTGTEMLGKIKRFYGRTETADYKIIEGLVDAASRKTGRDRLLYIEVNEGDNPRLSFDINLYDAELRLEEVEGFLMEMAAYYLIPEDQFMNVYQPIKTQTLGHLSGGRDRKGKAFITIYFSALHQT